VVGKYSLHSILTRQDLDIDNVRDQIAFLEKRLDAMSDGDSAYEKLLARYYGDMLMDRKALLAGMMA
jgi:hypothetical protein